MNRYPVPRRSESDIVHSTSPVSGRYSGVGSLAPKALSQWEVVEIQRHVERQLAAIAITARKSDLIWQVRQRVYTTAMEHGLQWSALCQAYLQTASSMLDPDAFEQFAGWLYGLDGEYVSGAVEVLRTTDYRLNRILEADPLPDQRNPGFWERLFEGLLG